MLSSRFGIEMITADTQEAKRPKLPTTLKGQCTTGVLRHQKKL